MPFSFSPPHSVDSQSSQVSAHFPVVELEITRGQARRRVRKVDVPVFLIGTANDCDLVLGDPQFPDVHSYLFLSAEGVWIRRLSSEPAISVEGRLVKSAQLCDGDHMRMGAYEFRLSIGSPAFWDGDDCNHDSAHGSAPSGRFAQAARRHRARSSAGLSVVQELLSESLAIRKTKRDEQMGVA